MKIGNSDPGLGQAHTCGGVRSINGIPTLPYPVWIKLFKIICEKNGI